MSNIEKQFKFKFRKLADLSRDDVWVRYLKPELLEMKRLKNEAEDVASSGYQAIVKEIARATTNQVVNKIIRLVEGAENKLNK